MQERIRRLRVLLAAAVVALAAFGVMSSSAHAEWLPCEGAGDFNGVGASFQREAQRAWGAAITAPAEVVSPAIASGFGEDYCSAFEIGLNNDIQYAATGSGSALTAFAARTGPRDTTVEYGGTDDAPTEPEIARANENGTPGNPDDDAVLKIIPVAQSAIVVALHLPTGCSLPNLEDRNIEEGALEGAFELDPAFETWGDIFPAMTGSGCRDKQFTRVVRLDSSGTTLQFKRYLDAVDGTEWLPPALPNTDWPNDEERLERGAANGNGPLVTELSLAAYDDEGAIGYSDLATARRNNPSYGDSGANDRFIWAGIERQPGTSSGQYELPARDQGENPAPEDRGARCESVNYSNPTGDLPGAEDWSAVTGVQAEEDYSLCILTFALIWEDASDAGIELPAYRGAVDYLRYATLQTEEEQRGGQELLSVEDYAPVPTSLVDVIREAIDLLLE